jgi:two-component system sensor histidine kinase QseC
MAQQKIVTFLTFNGKAEEAVAFYSSVFEGKLVSTMPGKDGGVLGLTFELFGQTFFALNGGPDFTFTHGISLFVNCDTQAEVDTYWEKLTGGGGKPVACGWLVDKFGVSWQIVPRGMTELLADKDRVAAGRAMEAMMKMVKLDFAALKRAFDGK